MAQQHVAKRNLTIMWFANFFIAGSMTMVLPFLSLYIESFGHFSEQYVQNWSGITFGITFVTAFLFSPVVGRMGDKFGRKNILIFMAFGMGLSIFLLGFADSVWELFLLRMFMGLFSGFIPVSQALISTQTPKESAGRILGTLQTGSITGSLMGPMLGGVLADSIGFATTFQSTSAFIILSGLLVLLVNEHRIDLAKGAKQNYSSREVLRHILSNPIMVNVLLMSMLVQIAHFSIQPILSLYVGELHGPENLAFYSGIAFSAAGLGNLLMAKRWGQIADQVGYIKILVILLLLSAVVYLPGGFVSSFWQLVMIRFLLGITIGGIIPVRVAYIRQEAPIEMQGEVLGYNTSLRFFGNIVGPVLGGFLAGSFGFTSVFMVTSGLLLISGLVLYSSMHRHPKFVRDAI